MRRPSGSQLRIRSRRAIMRSPRRSFCEQASREQAATPHNEARRAHHAARLPVNGQVRDYEVMGDNVPVVRVRRAE
jgi:hypothetical protein